MSTLDGPAPELGRFVTKKDNVRVVVPVARQGIIDWIANDERAFTQATTVAEETAEALPAETVSARPGEADVVLALGDALAQFHADEIIVAVEPGEDGLVQSISASLAHIDAVSVRFVTIDSL